jgi:hypothetical protein
MSTSAASIYAECLLPLKEGYPMYLPELPDRSNAAGDYEAYRSEGISIGDVGIITADGDFDFLFNICIDPHSRSSSQSAEEPIREGHDRDPAPQLPEQQQGLIGSRATLAGFTLINPGEIRVRRNYISPAHPYRAHGREAQMSIDITANINPIT